MNQEQKKITVQSNKNAQYNECKLHQSLQSLWTLFSEQKTQGDCNCWFKYVACTDPSTTGRLSLS